MKVSSIRSNPIKLNIGTDKRDGSQPFLSASLQSAKEKFDQKKNGFCSKQNQAVLTKLFDRVMK